MKKISTNSIGQVMKNALDVHVCDSWEVHIPISICVGRILANSPCVYAAIDFNGNGIIPIALTHTSHTKHGLYDIPYPNSWTILILYLYSEIWIRSLSIIKKNDCQLFVFVRSFLWFQMLHWEIFSHIWGFVLLSQFKLCEIFVVSFII